MPVLAYDPMLILLQCRQLASGTLKLDEEHATCGREEHSVRHASAARRGEFVCQHAKALGVEAGGFFYL